MDTAAAKKRCEAATEGPWYDSVGDVFRDAGEPIARCQTLSKSRPDARFIAHARSDLPAALEALEEAQGALKVIGDMHRSDGPNQFSLCIDVARAARDAILRGSKEGNDG